MSHEPKSRPVSWDDEPLTICCSKAESPVLAQDSDDTLSDVCFSYDEAGVESMTPFGVGCYSRRLWHIEKRRTLEPTLPPPLVVERGIAAGKVKRLVAPFQTTGVTVTKELHAETEDVVHAAGALFRMLLHDSSANYSLYDIKDQSYGEPLVPYSQLINVAPASTSAAPPTEMRLGIASA